MKASALIASPRAASKRAGGTGLHQGQGLRLQRKCACGGTPGPSGECEACRKKRLQRKSNAGVEPQSGSVVPSIVHEVLGSPGQPLDSATRAFMEPRFGYDFSRVRVHTDTRSEQSARDVNALAYTVGRQVVFGAGQFRPESETGQRLLAHELAHTIQQRGSEIGPPQSIVPPNDRSEREADETASEAVSGRRFLPNDKLDVAVAHKEAPLSHQAQVADGPRQPASSARSTAPDFAESFRPNFLTHPIIQRKKESEQNLLLTDAPEYPGCSPYQRFRLQNQIERARNMVATAIRAVSDELARKDRATGTISIAGSAISRYFHTTEARHIRTLLSRLGSIEKMLKRRPWNWRCVSDAECLRICQPPLADACAGPDGDEVTICSHWGQDDTGGARVLVHEAAHQAGIGLVGDVYEFDPRFTKISPEKALDTADTYADLARDISYGQGPSSEVWIPQDMWLAGWFNIPPTVPAFGTGPFTGRIPAAVVIENHLKGGFSFHSSGANPARRLRPRPTYLRQPIVSLKMVLHRTGSAKELGNRPRESVLFDLGGRTQQGGYNLFIPPESVDNAYRFEFSFDRADGGTLELTAQLRDEDTATTITHREKLQVRPTTASGSNVSSAKPVTKQPLEPPPRYPRQGPKHWKEMINETTFQYEPASWRPSLMYIYVSSDHPGCADYVFGPGGRASTCKASITASPCQNANIVFNVAYVIDHFDWPHPPPIYPLKVEALLEFTPTGGRTREITKRIDASPKYLGPQQPLETSFERKFPFSTNESGRLRIRFELVDSFGIRVVYDDGVNFAIPACKKGPAK